MCAIRSDYILANITSSTTKLLLLNAETYRLEGVLDAKYCKKPCLRYEKVKSPFTEYFLLQTMMEAVSQLLFHRTVTLCKMRRQI